MNDAAGTTVLVTGATAGLGRRANRRAYDPQARLWDLSERL